MQLSRAIEIRMTLTRQVTDLYAMAKSCRMTSESINERYNALFDSYPKLPHHVAAYVRGYRDCLSEQLYQNDLVHAYEWQGKLYEQWDSFPEELKEHVRKNPTEQLVSGHYWKGTDKPYFVGK